MKKTSFTIIGGDLRNLILGNLFSGEDYPVNIYGFENSTYETKLKEAVSLEEAIDDSDVVIGPLPCAFDGDTLNTPFHNGKIIIKDVFSLMKKNQLFIAGFINEKTLNLAKVCGVHAVDLLQREEMAVLNAIPTAEGAVQIAMAETPITLHGSNVLVLGYGRVGKVLSRILYGLGANVFVEARKFSDLAWIDCCGYKPVFIEELSEKLDMMNIIFNTIPHLILERKLLNYINKECLVIDLASKPGGIDLEAAGELGIKTIWALSLPGKVAPLTAAEYMKITVKNIISELGV